MNIIVCIKQVPAGGKVTLDPVKGTLMRENVEVVINENDRVALETALQLREKHGGKVTALTMGPAQADLALREAMAMGVDDAVLLDDRCFAGADTWSTARALATAIARLPWDLVVTGKMTSDGDTAQVGVQLAEQLHVPNLGNVTEVDLSGNTVTTESQFDDTLYQLETELPCLISVLPQCAAPRYMFAPDIFGVYDRPVTVHCACDLDLDPETVGLAGSPTQVDGLFERAGRAGGERIETDEDEAVARIVQALRERHVI